MKRLFAALAVVFLLSACAQRAEPVTTATTPTATTGATVPPTTEKARSLQLPEGVSVEDVILYFNEVCQYAEYRNEGDPTVLQKWVEPIRYCIDGLPTTEDLDMLEGFAAWLNTGEGFPGIRQTNDYNSRNMTIHFCDQQELIKRMGQNFEDCDGAVTIWFDDQGAIYEAVICIRTDLSQEVRNSVILEELYNGLGPMQDTALRPDSIIYQDLSQPQQLSELDELLLRLLYHPHVQTGMDARQCEEIIRSLLD